jgi:demethylmenaquinone methyltransferase/2-methoxy-6-polyprenyl-1,4-benzoquinol methylase
MFDSIAPRYDLFNDLLSVGIHRFWRADAIDSLAPVPGHRYLDLCAGTLDLARAITTRAPGAIAVGADFSLPMLERGARKLNHREAVFSVAADALALPVANRVFAGCTIGFGLRNLVDYAAGLSEMRRVLEPGGRLVVLEFTTPPGKLFRTLYHSYFHHLLPHAGALISGDPDAARYLPNSVTDFPDCEALSDMLTNVGFSRVRYRLLSGGIAALHTGVRE